MIPENLLPALPNIFICIHTNAHIHIPYFLSYFELVRFHSQCGYSNPFIITAFTAAFREMEFELRSEEKFGELAGRLGRVEYLTHAT